MSAEPVQLGDRRGDSPELAGFRRLVTEPAFVVTEPAFAAHCAANVWKSRHARDGWMVAPHSEWLALSEKERTDWIAEMVAEWKAKFDALASSGDPA